MLAMLRLILMTKLFNVFIELMATALFLTLFFGLMLMLIVGDFN